VKKKTLLILYFFPPCVRETTVKILEYLTSTLYDVEWWFVRSGRFNLNEELAVTNYGGRVDFSVSLDNTDTVQSRTPISQQVVRHFNSLQNITCRMYNLIYDSETFFLHQYFAPMIFVFHIILWFNCTPVQHALTIPSTGDVFSPRQVFNP